ncbi:hypothetical protein LTR37_010906 [Vermiconidia calcicola]|uniref:Uncharacterized protein n=1 Tax=Vermiconidia calcicola TaxID=1690605 RepID=A0ACC3N3L8_9PEZI|nr:hypothetical protein LTR37_010906 [Vermiconidia calcicola]
MALQLPDLDRFSLHVTIYLKAEDVPTFFEAFRPAFDAVSAEPECVYFELFQDPADPGTISWIENWERSPEWLMTNQIPKDYYKPYFAATEPLFVRPREFKMLKRVGAPYVVSKAENLR